MATREENLKKINDELEKLDDEQLDQVAGGSQSENLELRETLLHDSKMHLVITSDEMLKNVLRTKFGIDADIHNDGKPNSYIDRAMQESMSHEEVLDLIKHDYLWN